MLVGENEGRALLLKAKILRSAVEHFSVAFDDDLLGIGEFRTDAFDAGVVGDLLFHIDEIEHLRAGVATGRAADATAEALAGRGHGNAPAGVRPPGRPPGTRHANAP